MRILRTLLVITLAALLSPWSASTSMADEEPFVVKIKVSPKMFAAHKYKRGGTVTVHAGRLLYEDVDLDSLTLAVDGEVVDDDDIWAKPDDRGYLVVKCYFQAVAALMSPPFATLTLAGEDVDGAQFEGSRTVRVKD